MESFLFLLLCNQGNISLYFLSWQIELYSEESDTPAYVWDFFHL